MEKELFSTLPSLVNKMGISVSSAMAVLSSWDWHTFSWIMYQQHKIWNSKICSHSLCNHSQLLQQPPQLSFTEALNCIVKVASSADHYTAQPNTRMLFLKASSSSAAANRTGQCRQCQGWVLEVGRMVVAMWMPTRLKMLIIVLKPQTKPITKLIKTYSSDLLNSAKLTIFVLELRIL